MEAIINCHSLTFIYYELEEPSLLTPAHLLIGKRILGLPAERQNDLNRITKENLTKRFRLRETLLNHFRKRCRKECILQLRTAHYTDQKKLSEFEVNYIILIHNEQTSCLLEARQSNENLSWKRWENLEHLKKND